MANIVQYDPGDAKVPGRVIGYLKSAHTPDFSGNILVNPDVSALSGVPRKYWKESSGSVVEMTAAEKVTFDLADQKVLRNADIDKKTSELISNGFVYDSVVFSLSQNAQLNAIGMKVLEESGGNITPLDITTKADTSYTITNKAALDNWFLQGFGTKKAHLDSGRALKVQIDAATTQAELDAVVDNR